MFKLTNKVNYFAASTGSTGWALSGLGPLWPELALVGPSYEGIHNNYQATKTRYIFTSL
jgi:hypothetical protein